MQPELFPADDAPLALPTGVCLLRGFAFPVLPRLFTAIDDVITQAPLRNMRTPGGYRMSVAMTNCGDYGWTSSPSGYAYLRRDPQTDRPWPAIPLAFMSLALDAAEQAGYPFFTPDACLINRYHPGTRLSLHQDRDEVDFEHPIVSVSLGLPAVFQLGGLKRRDPVQRIDMRHGDILVWGGPSRLAYHGVQPIKDGVHTVLGAQRINLTFRRSH